MEYEIQYARLATTDKLPDRFLNTSLKGNADLAKTQMGEVFSMIEILTQWFTTAQIGQTIINTFATSYYNGGSTSDLVNFEESLKKVNETLAQVTQNGETDWIGNINAVLGIIIENKMHIAQTGRANAYVFRDGKAENLTEDLAQGGEPHPLKTFTNITSGELKSHDKILIANPELFLQIDLENLRQIITMNNPNEAVMHLAKLLKKKRVGNVNALVIQLLTTEELAKQPVSNDNNTIFLDKPLESAFAGLERFWHGILHPVIKSMGQESKKATDKSLTFTKNYLKTLHDKRQASAESTKSALVQKKDLFDKEFIDRNDEQADDHLLKDEEIKYSPELEVHFYQQQQKENDNKINGFLSKFKRYFFATINFIFKILKDKKYRPYLYVVLAIIILLFIGLFIKNRSGQGPKVDLSEAQATLKSAENYLSDANKASASKNNDQAKQFCATAITTASPITTFAVVGSDAKKVVNDCYVLIDTLSATTRFNSLNPIISLDQNISGSFVISSRAYFVSGANIYSALISGGQPSKVASIPQGGGNFLFGVTSGDEILLYTSNQKVYDFKTTNSQISLSAPASGNWESANSGAMYSGSFYLLDSVIGQVYKHIFTSGVAQAGTSYITSTSVDVKGSKSIAIDGSVYVLKADGSVIMLQKGKLKDFALKDTPTPYSKIEKPVKIYTDSDASSIYVLDNAQKRVLEYDKNGNYIHQYALPSSLGDLTDMNVSVKAKKIWVTSDKSLYEISI